MVVDYDDPENRPPAQTLFALTGPFGTGVRIGTFGDEFFDAYRALAPLDADFFRIRKDIYNIYPNLVHAALFGRSYVPAVTRVLDRLGL